MHKAQDYGLWYYQRSVEAWSLKHFIRHSSVYIGEDTLWSSDDERKVMLVFKDIVQYLLKPLDVFFPGADDHLWGLSSQLTKSSTVWYLLCLIHKRVFLRVRHSYFFTNYLLRHSYHILILNDLAIYNGMTIWFDGLVPLYGLELTRPVNSTDTVFILKDVPIVVNTND